MTHLPVAKRRTRPKVCRQMPVFTPLPLGQRIPSSLHAVSCSLPTLGAVRGYEEKNPEVTRHLTSGYPRFVIHPFLARLAHHLTQRHALGNYCLWLVSSKRMGDRLAQHLGGVHVVRIEEDGVHAVAHTNSPDLASRAKTFLQNTGGFLSSRAAEDRLAQHHLVEPTPEKLFAGDALSEVRGRLAPLFPEVAASDLHLTNTGMSAVDAAFRSVVELQALRGRTIWIQLGWLYLDTIALLQKYTPSASDYIEVVNVFDRAELEAVFAAKGHHIAGIFSEVPTNPLVQTPDVAAIAALARQHGALVVLDPSTSSVFDVDVLRHADVVVCSLTKYAANEGDLTAGLVVVNPASPDASQLRRGVAAKIEPLYARDLRRLALQIGGAAEVLAQMHTNVKRVVEFLSAHPGVQHVYWALEENSRENYRKIARHADAVGGMITFTLRGSLQHFYDRLTLPKGPSFGMKTTLICPYMYLAHYDLVNRAEGRAELTARGIDPDLLRLAVGTEPADEIVGALRNALDAVA